MSHASATRPFPWRSLDSLKNAEAAVLGGALRWAAAYVRLGEVEGALGRILGTRVELRLRRTTVLSRARPLGAGYGLLLAADDASRVGPLLQVESALAANVVARVVKRAPPVVHDPAPESFAIAGAFGAIVAAAARRSHSGDSIRILKAGFAAALETSLTQAEEDIVAVELTVTVGDDAYGARILLATSLARSAPEAPWSKAHLSALGATPLSLPVVAVALQTTTSDAASLELGDVLLLPAWPLARSESGEGWTGPLFLASPSSSVGIRCEVSKDGRLVLRGDSEALCIGEADMVESEGESSALVTAVGEIPVLVRVEIGEARMSAREWAELHRGSVISLSRRVGERVTLRIGGVPVATGELVEIEGAVGVRIVERINAGPTST
jgi:type III secretion system YscQ/HrcQ family protein